MAGLMGLSPQEISAISGRRTAAESDRYKMAGMLINMMGVKQQGELAKRKLDLLENPPMVKMKIADQIYEIPKQSQIEGAKAKAEVEERLRTGRISQVQHDAWMKPVMTSLPRGDGGWIDYEVPSGMLESMASGIKSLQDVRVSGVEQERKRKGIEALGGQTVEELYGAPATDIAAVMPGILPTMAARPRAGTAAAGLKPEERRKLIVDHEVTATSMLEKGAETSDASVSAYNDRSKTLGYPSMMLKYGGQAETFMGIPYTGGEGLIEVKLPVVGGRQIIPADVEKMAKTKKMSIKDILKTIYEGQQIMENSRR